MPLTAADLDSKICNHCRRLLRAHCTVNEGVWYYTPCTAHLLALAPPDWPWLVSDGDQRCLHCFRSILAHFTLWTPQASIAVGDATVDVFASGSVIVKMPSAFIDCR